MQAQTLEDLVGVIQKLVTQVTALSEQVASQQAAMAKYEEELGEFKELLSQAGLKPTPSTPSGNSGDKDKEQAITTATHKEKNQATNKARSKNQLSRSNFLKRVATTSLVALGAGSASLVNSPEAAARLVINPEGYSNQFGAIIYPTSSAFSGQPPLASAKFGVITTGNPALDLAKLPSFDTGLYAAGEGNGIYATCNNRQGFGIYASNTATTGATGNAFGVYGTSTVGTGVFGASAGFNAGTGGDSADGPGVSGTSTRGPGVKAYSMFGVPLSITSGGTPIAGIRQFGDVYVDSTGKPYIWALNEDGITSTWRRLAFAT